MNLKKGGIFDVVPSAPKVDNILYIDIASGHMRFMQGDDVTEVYESDAIREVTGIPHSWERRAYLLPLRRLIDPRRNAQAIELRPTRSTLKRSGDADGPSRLTAFSALVGAFVGQPIRNC